MTPQPLMAPQSQATRRYVLLTLDADADGAGVVPLIERARREHAMAAEVVRCRSADEACVRLASGRRYSAVVADPGRADPSAVEGARLAAAAAGAATPVIALAPRSPDAADALVRVVSRSSSPVVLADRPPDLGSPSDSGPPWPGRLIACCGAGGAGTSTVAASLAAGLAGADLLLGDFALCSDQASLHGRRADAPDTVDGGLLELVRAFRRQRDRMTSARVRGHTVAAGGFRLLPGLGRPSHWTAVSRAAFDLALAGLCSAFEVVVADVTGEFEGESQVGSLDIEDRNHMARRVVSSADVVVVVGRPGATGARRVRRMVADLLDLGIDPDRVLPVVNRVNRVNRVESGGVDRDGWLDGVGARVLALPEAAVEDGCPAPAELVGPLCAAVRALLAGLPPAGRGQAMGRVLVTPGSLGSWAGADPS